ncbi:uncharacterized protein LOC132543632 [Ylistrum balloti]|uniref:uncharacterized protein LOC132543632 n=1 Tax=Ylistrum balloti TaxID=509963 RepID=UPI00290589F0|nr:uncharacterized protein LOC132543632 [Ylistrum balloti]
MAFSFGNTDRNWLSLINPPVKWQAFDTGNQIPPLQNLDPDQSPQKWLELFTLIYRKMEGMEHQMVRKNERIDQLELHIARQMTTIKRLEQEMLSMKDTMLEKEVTTNDIATRVSDLETFLALNSSPGNSAFKQTSKPYQNSRYRLGKLSDSISRVVNMSSSQALTLQASNPQNDGIMPPRSKQHLRDEDNHHPYQPDDHSNYTISGDLLKSRFKPKGAASFSLQEPVAFHVFLSRDAWVVNDDVIMYDQVALDQGDGYVPRLGIYVVPESGTYVITWTMYCYGQELFRTLLLLNGDVKGSSWTDSELSKDIHQSSALVVLTLNQGDHVFIRMGPIFGNATLLSRNDVAVSTFSGWKLG